MAKSTADKIKNFSEKVTSLKNADTLALRKARKQLKRAQRLGRLENRTAAKRDDMVKRQEANAEKAKERALKKKGGQDKALSAAAEEQVG